MRIIYTYVHGILDYLTGLLLIAAPYMFGFANGGAAQWVPMVLGVAAILYSLLTRYEWGLVKVIPMPAHLAIDGAHGALLAASPWLFGFAHEVHMPHLLLGLFEIAVTAMSRSAPDAARETRPGAFSH